MCTTTESANGVAYVMIDLGTHYPPFILLLSCVRPSSARKRSRWRTPRRRTASGIPGKLGSLSIPFSGEAHGPNHKKDSFPLLKPGQTLAQQSAAGSLPNCQIRACTNRVRLRPPVEAEKSSPSLRSNFRPPRRSGGWEWSDKSAFDFQLGWKNDMRGLGQTKSKPGFGLPTLAENSGHHRVRRVLDQTSEGHKRGGGSRCGARVLRHVSTRGWMDPCVQGTKGQRPANEKC